MNEYNYNIFTPNGKMKRGQFFLGLFIISIPYLVFKLTDSSFFVVISLVSSYYFSTMFCAKRLADIGLSRWISLLNLIPFFKILFQIILMILPSKEDKVE